ncbi:MAG: cyclodeaminase/cyclohydrolase family protein [Pyramidobacter sp.]|nr:cyclodeaminase/cyclohydrolase family protein [Pyramidobacter sp.]
MRLSEMTVTAFTEELASSSPAPGGGSIAALGAALAAGLASMVGELTSGREKYKDAQEDMDALRARGKELVAALLKLMEDDTESFNGFMAALKLPKETDEQKQVRRDAMQAAAKVTVEVPMRTLTLCAEAAQMAVVAATKGNTNAVTDAGTAGQFARAAAVSAAYNVRINLMSIKDTQYVEETRAKMNALLEATEKAFAEISARLEEALA